MINKIIHYTAVASLILIFTFTGFSKILENEKFIFQLKLSPLSSIKDFAIWLSWIIPVVHIVIVILLLIPWTRIIGMYFSLLLLLSYSAYIMGILASNLSHPCTCGGITSSISWEGQLAINIALGVLTSINIKTTRQSI